MNSPLEIAMQVLGGACQSADWLWWIHEPAMVRVMSRPRVLDVEAVLQAAAKSKTRTEGTVAIFPITGVIYKEAYYADETSSTRLRSDVLAALADDNVTGGLVVSDSPGGSTAGLTEAGDALAAFAAAKPLWGQVSGMACSAAYYLMMSCEKIFSQRMDTIGSIGTRLQVFDYSKMFENLGIKSYAIDTGPYKSTGAFGSELTADQRSFLQSYVDSTQKEFARAVQAGRKFTGDQLSAVADGRFWKAAEAKQLGLIDGIQNFEQTFSQLAALAAPTKGAKQMTTPADTAASGTKTVATMTELGLLPGVTNDFIVEAMKAAWTADQAQSTWMERQQKEIIALKQQNADAAKIAAAAGSGGVSSTAVAEPGKGGNVPGSSTAASGAEFQKTLKALQKEHGQLEGMRKARAEDPDGYTAWLEEYNAAHDTGSKARERFTQRKSG